MIDFVLFVTLIVLELSRPDPIINMVIAGPGDVAASSTNKTQPKQHLNKEKKKRKSNHNTTFFYYSLQCFDKDTTDSINKIHSRLDNTSHSTHKIKADSTER